jgi:hypothetical protein
MCDKLVFDLSQEVEGSPNVFIRKDWINILDNQNQNYQNNQSIIDTSQLSNSNKYMSYREAYLAVPLTLTMTSPNSANCGFYNIAANDANGNAYTPPGNNGSIGVNGQGTSDYAIGLKNWFGQVIHSFTLDYNGTTICQQTPFCNMWNTFKLLTTLSYSDILTQGPTIGFYPDTSSSWIFQNVNNVAYGVNTTLPTSSQNGIVVCNNDLASFDSSFGATTTAIGSRYICNGVASNISGLNKINPSTGAYNATQNQASPVSIATGGNVGLTKRISWINYNPKASLGSTQSYENIGITGASCQNVWKSYISTQLNGTNAQCGILQISVMATIYLKHVHAFFNMVPLLKGVFMKMTMNLNNASSNITVGAAVAYNAVGPVVGTDSYITTYNTTVPVGGVNPLLIPSFRTGSKFTQGVNTLNTSAAAVYTFEQQAGNYWYNISVGSKVTGINPNVTGLSATLDQYTNTLSKSIYLYVPAYTFNPVFEQAYLSNPVKQVKYTDIYQYQVLNTPTGAQFNNLITNGIANIKSVLIIPFISPTQPGGNTPGPEYQSPFDPAGCGATAPMVTLGNFNIQISGQNAIYNTQRYTFEQFNDQLYGQNSVNGGLTDGLTSGLIGFQDFLQSYCYYYVNVERMLPVEQSVPKSVQILGTNYSTQNIDMWVFVEYGVEINIDLETGARV